MMSANKLYLVNHLQIPFDEIILHVIPLLKNGVTPEKQTVASVLHDLAKKTSAGTWKLNKDGQLKMFE